MRVPRVPLVPAWMRWAAVAVVALAIFYLSVVAVPPEDPVVPGKPTVVALDKWRHFLAYGAFSSSLAYALADRPWRTGAVVAVGVGAAVGYGIGIEGAQSLIPYRYFSLGDALANAIGAVLASPLYIALRRARFREVLVDVAPWRHT